MLRSMLTEEHWSKLKKIMREEGIYDKPGPRMIVEGMLATRYDKLKRNYESTVAMACGFLWLPM